MHAPVQPPRITHLHLDALGGIAGDMFCAALLDAFPTHEAAACAAAEAIAGVSCRRVAHQDGGLTGSRFMVSPDQRTHHHHAHWADIRARLEQAALPDGVRSHALGIFTILAEAEAAVHGIDVARVAFHEVGAADSIADIVAAAWLIDAVGPVRWSVGPLPLGGGTVASAHGPLPVPAPATVRLLDGFAMVDDGVGGERVTPTGAAILRHLAPVPRQGLASRLGGSGHGFGTRQMPGMSNLLRLLVFAEDSPAVIAGHRELAVIGFEIDDQPAEDLAAGLDRLRAMPGVHDVLQMPAFGKKGRMATHVQVLARPDLLEEAIAGCFRETTTIGLRSHVVQGRALPRRQQDVRVDGRTVRVKHVERPGGATCKAEADDLLSLAGHDARVRLRRAAEALAERDGDE
jgi:uncharacterized protein (TIGR00299 family) protein